MVNIKNVIGRIFQLFLFLTIVMALTNAISPAMDNVQEKRSAENLRIKKAQKSCGCVHSLAV